MIKILYTLIILSSFQAGALEIQGPLVTCQYFQSRSPFVLHVISEPETNYTIPREVLREWETKCGKKIDDFEIKILAHGKKLSDAEVKMRLRLDESSLLKLDRPIWIAGEESLKLQHRPMGKILISSKIDQVDGTYQIRKSALRLKKNGVVGDLITTSDVEEVFYVNHDTAQSGLLELIDLPRKLSKSPIHEVILKTDTQPAETLLSGSLVSLMIVSGNLDLKTEAKLMETAHLGKPVRVYVPQTQKTLSGVYRGDGKVEVSP